MSATQDGLVGFSVTRYPEPQGGDALTLEETVRWIHYWELTARDEAVLSNDQLRRTPIDFPHAQLAMGGNAQTLRPRLLAIRRTLRTSRNGNPSAQSPSISVLVAPFVFRSVPSHQTATAGGPDVVVPLWVPAQITEDGQWEWPPEDDASGRRPLPWVAREYLEPLMGNALWVIGTLEAVDAQLAQWVWPARENDWAAYLAAAVNLLPSGWAERLRASGYDGPDQIDTQDQRPAWVLPDDDPRGALRNIIDTYGHLRRHPTAIAPLVTEFANPRPSVPRLLTTEAEAHAAVYRHWAHVGKEPLNADQRRGLSHALALEPGRLMALNGPPGTGKTAWVHALWSSLWTEAAIKGSAVPPLVVVASTNNQAVGNVLASLNDLGKSGNAVSRWLPGISRTLGLLIKTQDDARMPLGTLRASWGRGGFESPFEKVMTPEAVSRATSAYLHHVRETLGDAVPPGTSLEQAVKAWHGHLEALARCYQEDGAHWVLRQQLAAGVPEGFERAIADADARRLEYQRRVRAWEVAWSDWGAFRRRFTWSDRLLRLTQPRRWRDQLQTLVAQHGWEFAGPWKESALAVWLTQQDQGARADAHTAEQTLSTLTDQHETWKAAGVCLENITGGPPDAWDVWADTARRRSLFEAALHYWEGRWLLEAQRRLTVPAIRRGASFAEHRC